MCLYNKVSYSRVCCLPLAAAVLLLAFLHLIEAAYLILRHHDKSHPLGFWVTKGQAMIDVFDAVTGILAVMLTNRTLAFCAFLGSIVDCVGHAIVVIVWTCIWLWKHIRGDEAALEWLHVGRLGLMILDSAVFCLLGYWFMLIFWSYYRVVELGGTGWEKRSAEDMIDEEYGGVGGGIYASHPSSGKKKGLKGYGSMRTKETLNQARRDEEEALRGEYK